MAVLIPTSTTELAYSMDLVGLVIAPSASKEVDRAPYLPDWEAELHRIAMGRLPKVRFKMAPTASLRKSPLFEAAIATVIKVAACMLAYNK